jgi:hypothetical protein
MMSQKEIRESVQVGTVYDVTNHYITREDHPCFGTQRRTVVRVSASNLTLSLGEHDVSCQAWGKGLERDEDGTVRMFGHPTAGDLFLTLAPVSS